MSITVIRYQADARDQRALDRAAGRMDRSMCDNIVVSTERAGHCHGKRPSGDQDLLKLSSLSRFERIPPLDVYTAMCVMED